MGRGFGAQGKGLPRKPLCHARKVIAQCRLCGLFKRLLRNLLKSPNTMMFEGKGSNKDPLPSALIGCLIMQTLKNYSVYYTGFVNLKLWSVP